MISLLLDLSKILLTTLFSALLTPIFWLVILLVYLQYRRAAGVEQKLFGRTINPVGFQVAVSTGLGILGGFLASAFMLLMGLSLAQIGLLYIWPVALLLLLVHPRFLCFSYAGGIVALAVLVLRYIILPVFPGLAGYLLAASLLEIHLPALLALIGLLHMMESLLIYIGGHWGSSPLYFKRSDGEVVGAFSLRRFWPIPLAALLVTVVLESEIQGVNMPEWWPLIKSTLELEQGQSLQYLAVPALAALGYSDLALSSTPREKSLSTARYLCLYSVVLIGLALAAEFYPWLTPAGVLFAPLGHEAVIYYGNRREHSRAPRYRQSREGVPLMAVLPNSAAFRAGLHPGDLICRVNSIPVQDDLELLLHIEESYFMVSLDGSRDGKSFSVILNKHRFGKDENKVLPFGGSLSPARASLWHRGAALGLIPAPSRQTPVYAEAKQVAVLSLLRRIWGRFNRS